MVKLENAEFFIKLQLFVASFLLVSGFCLSLFSTTSKLKDCDGAGADILLLIDAAHTRRYGKMNLYSKALMERFFVNTKKQECRFKMVEYQSYPLEAVDMGFLNGDFEDNNVDIKKKTTSKNLKFLVIFTAREEVYNEETQAVIDRVAALNVITVVVAFNYPHKVPIEDLEEIASDNFYIFVAEHMHANNLISSIVNVICREVKAETLFNRDHKNKFDVLYDCGESNPCYFKLLNQNLHSFPYSNPRKFVECEDIGRCAIGECVYGHFWDELTRTCH